MNISKEILFCNALSGKGEGEPPYLLSTELAFEGNVSRV